MPVPITNLGIDDIKRELYMPINASASIDDLFTHERTCEEALNKLYCPDMATLISKPYSIGRFRGFQMPRLSFRFKSTAQGASQSSGWAAFILVSDQDGTNRYYTSQHGGWSFEGTENIPYIAPSITSFPYINMFQYGAPDPPTTPPYTRELTSSIYQLTGGKTYRIFFYGFTYASPEYPNAGYVWLDSFLDFVIYGTPYRINIDGGAYLNNHKYYFLGDLKTPPNGGWSFHHVHQIGVGYQSVLDYPYSP
jgi:hypothetical protein